MVYPAFDGSRLLMLTWGQLEGQNFGSTADVFSVQMRLHQLSPRCTLCFVSHTLARCGAITDRALVYNLTATVSGKSSNVAVFNYVEIMKNPEFTRISPLVGPTTV
jgi:hypothetical protein